MCVLVRMSSCMNVFLSVCVCVVFMRVFFLREFVCVRACVRTYVFICVRPCVCTCVFVFMCMCVRACV